MSELPKRFNHEVEEDKIYAAWKKSGFFSPEKCVADGIIATARPETKFGDKYMVMHPDDKYYHQYKNG